MGLRAELLLLCNVDWSLLRARSFSVWAKMGTVFLDRWTWSYRQLIQGGVVGQVDVGPQDTVSGHVVVDPVDVVRVKVFPW